MSHFVAGYLHLVIANGGGQFPLTFIVIHADI